ncbi:MAG: hypothetical protein AAFW98_10645, partial [Pseudomonadota bacterium]
MSVLALVLLATQGAGAQTGGSTNGTGGLLSKVRTAMGLSPRPGAPMMLLPRPDQAFTAPTMVQTGIEPARLAQRQAAQEPGTALAIVARANSASPRIKPKRAPRIGPPPERVPTALPAATPPTVAAGPVTSPLVVPRPHPRRAGFASAAAVGATAGTLAGMQASEIAAESPGPTDTLLPSDALLEPQSQPDENGADQPQLSDIGEGGATIDISNDVLEAPPADETPVQQDVAESMPPLPAPDAVDDDVAGAPSDERQQRAQADEPTTGRPAATSDASELPRLMRQMSALQDAIAQGSTTALAAQRVIGDRLEKAVRDISTDVLQDPTIADALLAYALTGGSPQVVRGVVAKTDYPPPYNALLAGALAFLEGRQSDAT